MAPEMPTKPDLRPSAEAKAQLIMASILMHPVQKPPQNLDSILRDPVQQSDAAIRPLVAQLLSKNKELENRLIAWETTSDSQEIIRNYRAWLQQEAGK